MTKLKQYNKDRFKFNFSFLCLLDDPPEKQETTQSFWTFAFEFQVCPDFISLLIE